VERSDSYRVDDGRSWRRGAAESRQRTHVEVLMRGGGAMVASSVGSTKFMRILTMKIAWWFDGCDDICSMYMRCLLRVLN
jgi:hypothetical protein